jgi:hypothetical protein
LTVFTDRHTRFDDKLCVALLLLPAIFAGARYLESRAQMDQIGLHCRLPATILAKAPSQLVATNASIVHRF